MTTSHPTQSDRGWRRQRNQEQALLQELLDSPVGSNAPQTFTLAAADLCFTAGLLCALFGIIGMVGVLPFASIYADLGIEEGYLRAALLEGAPLLTLLAGLVLIGYFFPAWRTRTVTGAGGLVYIPGPGQPPRRIAYAQICQVNAPRGWRGRSGGLRIRYYALDAAGQVDTSSLRQITLPVMTHNDALLHLLQRRMAGPLPTCAMLGTLQHQASTRPLRLVGGLAVLTVFLLLLDWLL